MTKKNLNLSKIKRVFSHVHALINVEKASRN